MPSGLARLSLNGSSSLSLIAAVTLPLPPLQRNRGWLSDVSRLMSWVRPERIGPTSAAVCEWNTAANLVQPSTFSSKTMSVWLSPACGTASGALSILTTIARRSAFGSLGSASGRPVSGQVGAGAAVVVVAGSVLAAVVLAAVDVVVLALVVVGATVVVAAVVVVSALSSPPPQAASARPATRPNAMRRREV